MLCSGHLDLKEVQSLFGDICKRCNARPLSEERVKQIFEKLDLDGDGGISPKEWGNFLAIMIDQLYIDVWILLFEAVICEYR